MRPRREAIDPEMLADVVKEDVAGFHDRPMQRNAAMALLAPASILTAAEIDSARTAVGGLRRQGVIFKSRYRVDQFKGRARRIDPLNHAIRQGMRWIGG